MNTQIFLGLDSGVGPWSRKYYGSEMEWLLV